MLQRMRLGTKIWLALVLVSLIGALVGVVGIIGLNSATDHYDTISENNLPEVQHYSSLAIDMLTIIAAERGLINPGMMKNPKVRQAQFAKTDAAWAHVDTLWQQLDALVKHDDSVKAHLPQLKAAWLAWKAQHDKVRTLANEREHLLAQGVPYSDTRITNLDAQALAQSVQSREVFLVIDGMIRDLIATANTIARKNGDTADVRRAQTRQQQIAVVVIGVIFSMLIGFFFARYTGSILASMMSETSRLSTAAVNGDLATRGQTELINHEFRGIIQGFNATLDAVAQPLHEAMRVMSRLAQNDLTTRMSGEYVGEFGQMQANVNHACEELEATLQAVSGIAQDVASTADQFSVTVENVGKASQEVAEGAQQVAMGASDQTKSATDVANFVMQLQEAISELARVTQIGAVGAVKSASAAEQSLQAVQRIADAAVHAREDAQQAGKVAEEGAVIMQQTVAGMQRTQQASASSSVRINALGDSSKKIGEIVEAINDIAEQTNLLALNAAIEAARAGEHGKGFAVVADEVRKLAERSASQTKEIGVLIRGIKEGIEVAVSSMAIASQEVEESVSLANKAGASLNHILDTVGKAVTQVNVVSDICREVETSAQEVLKAAENVTSATDQANAATEEIASASKEMGNAIEHVAAVTQESSATAEQLSAAAEEQNASIEEMTASSRELADLAERTRGLLGQFKLEGTQTSVKLSQTTNIKRSA